MDRRGRIEAEYGGLPKVMQDELNIIAKAKRLGYLNRIAKKYVKPEYLGRFSFFDAPLIGSITLVLDWGQALGGQHWHFKKDQFMTMTNHQMTHSMLKAVKLASS
jgi:hypothetical protein